MKRNLFFGVTLFFMMASCSTDTTVGDLLKGGNKNSANNTLKYCNTVVKYDSDATKHLKQVKEDLPIFEQCLNQKEVTGATMSYIFTGIPLTNEIGFGADKVDILKPNTLLTDEISEKVKPKVEAMVESYNKTKEAYETIRDYISNEDYKDDNWLKAKNLVSQMKNNLDKYYKNSSKYFKIIKPISIEAEEVILEDHPLKKEIIHAKKTLNTIDLILDDINEVNPDMSKLNKNYSTLEKQVKTGSSMDTKTLKEHYKDSLHKSFYDEVNDFLGEIRKSKRDKTITDDEYNSIMYTFRQIISYYNSFVN